MWRMEAGSPWWSQLVGRGLHTETSPGELGLPSPTPRAVRDERPCPERQAVTQSPSLHERLRGARRDGTWEGQWGDW